MTEFDDHGFLKGRPIKPSEWRNALPGMPDGRIITDNTVPPGLLMVQNFLSPAWCDSVVKLCDGVAGERPTIGEGASPDGLELVADAARSSDLIDVRTLPIDINGVVRAIFGALVAPHYRVEIDWFERPEILRYRPGGEYKPHADTENWLQGEKRWTRVLDRDLSILLYLNEGYQGGELAFPNFGLSFKPQRGLLIAFPADGRYVHAALPVAEGVRYVLVSWAAVKGGPRVGTGPPPFALRM